MLWIYVLVALAHLLLLARGAQPWDLATKALLAPILALGVVLVGGPWLLVLALSLYAVGDVCLEFERLFLPGMAAFAAGHITLITLFWRSADRPQSWILAVLYLLTLAMLAFFWRGLDRELRLPVLAYSLLLVTMAGFALSHSWLVGAGALIFVASDSLIAARISHRLPDSAWLKLAIMVTYATAIALLAQA